MKKALILFIVFGSLVSQAQFYKAIMTFENGTKKTVFAELAKLDDVKINFKSKMDAQTESVYSDKLTKIAYSPIQGENYIAERLYIYTSTGEGSFKKSEGKSWLYLMYNGAVKMAVNQTQPLHSNGTFALKSGINVYFGKKNKNGVYYTYFKPQKMSMSLVLNDAIKNVGSVLFADCPKINEAFLKEKFEIRNAHNRVIALFGKNKCN